MLDENCNQKTTSVVKDGSYCLADTAVKIKNHLRQMNSHIKNHDIGSFVRIILICNKSNIKCTFSRYVNQKPNVVALDTFGKIESNCQKTVQAGMDILPLKNTEIVFKTDRDCSQCHYTFDQVNLLNNHVLFVHNHATANSNEGLNKDR